MAKKSPKLEFNKKKSETKNFKEFEKYVLGLNKEFGEILLRHLKTSSNLREDIKIDVDEYINKES